MGLLLTTTGTGKYALAVSRVESGQRLVMGNMKVVGFK